MPKIQVNREMRERQVKYGHLSAGETFRVVGEAFTGVVCMKLQDGSAVRLNGAYAGDPVICTDQDFLVTPLDVTLTYRDA